MVWIGSCAVMQISIRDDFHNFVFAIGGCDKSEYGCNPNIGAKSVAIQVFFFSIRDIGELLPCLVIIPLFCPRNRYLEGPPLTEFAVNVRKRKSDNKFITNYWTLCLPQYAQNIERKAKFWKERTRIEAFAEVNANINPWYLPSTEHFQKRRLTNFHWRGIGICE